MGRKSSSRQVTDTVVDNFLDPTVSSKKKRKRKEKETVDAPEEATPGAVDANPENTELRRKKKKRRHTEGAQTEEQNSLSSPSDQHAVDGEQPPPVPEPGKKKKKKKKRHAEHQEEQRINPTSDAQIDPSLTALDKGTDNTNAFLNAIVTAANGTPVQGHPQGNDIAHQPSFEAPNFNNLPAGLGGPVASFSGEDLARALQSLDVSKLADALHALGEAGTGAFPLPGQPGSQQPHPPRQGLGEIVGNSQASVPIDPTSIGDHSQNPRVQTTRNPARNRRSAPATSPQIPRYEDHAHLLANKWISATKLNDLTKSIGLQYKKGKFSATEEALLRHTIEDYRMRNGLSDEQLNEVIFAKGTKDKDNAFWFDITSHIPLRPVVAVYHHVRRSFHPLKQQGKWTAAEDDALRQAVAEIGQSWEKVSQRVGRMAGDCRDRWRNHINNREGRVFGAWTKEEEDRLTQIVTEMTTAQGKNPDLDVFWTQVAARMGSRGRQQCRIKWTDCLSKTVKNSGQRPRWSQQDAYILVHKIDSLSINDDSEIDWKLLSDESWNLWSAHTLQRRWLTLKRSVRSHEEMTHQEIMDILRVKKAHPPPMPTPAKRRVTSAPIVPAEAQASDVAIEDTFSLPSSSGFGGVHGSAFPSVSVAQPPSQLGPPVVQAEPAAVVVPTTVATENAGAGPSNINIQVQESDADDESSSSSSSDTEDSDSN